VFSAWGSQQSDLKFKFFKFSMKNHKLSNTSWLGNQSSPF
jgi:hypothetical protein